MKLPADVTCRISKGGCGRKVEIILEPKSILAFGALRRQTFEHRAVHEDEPGDRTRVFLQKFYRLRESLEFRCARERREVA